MAKYWALSEANVLGPLSAEEVVRLPDFNPGIPVCPAEGAWANWLSAGSIPEIAAASKHLAPAGPRPSERGRPSGYAVISPSGEGMAESLESIESRIARLDSRLERREEVVDEVAQRILDFHRLFNKHLNALRDQWDQERSQFRSAVEERIDKRAIQLEDALCKAGQMQSLLNEAFRALEEEKESYRAFIAENLHQDLEKKFLEMRDELLQIMEKTGKGLNDSIQQRMEDFSHRLESGMSALGELESKIRPKQYRLEELIEREESLNHMLESGLRRSHLLEDQGRGDEPSASGEGLEKVPVPDKSADAGLTSRRLRNKASADMFSEFEQRLRQTRELGKNLSNYFAEIRSGWKADFESFKVDFKAIKSASEDFKESAKQYRQSWENSLAERLKNFENSTQGEIEEIKQSIRETSAAKRGGEISDLSEPLEKLAERIDNLEQQFARNILDFKTQTVRSELPVIIGSAENFKDKKVAEQDAEKKWKFKDNIVLIITFLAFLAALALFFLSH